MDWFWLVLELHGGGSATNRCTASKLLIYKSNSSCLKILNSNHTVLGDNFGFKRQFFLICLPLYWVNLSKRVGKDGIFQGLAGLLRGISRGQRPRERPRSSAASQRKTPSFVTLLLRFTFYFQHNFSKYWGQQATTFFWKLFQLTSDDKFQILTKLSFHEFVVHNIFLINHFVVGPLWKVVKKL